MEAISLYLVRPSTRGQVAAARAEKRREASAKTRPNGIPVARWWHKCRESSHFARSAGRRNGRCEIDLPHTGPHYGCVVEHRLVAHRGGVRHSGNAIGARPRQQLLDDPADARYLGRSATPQATP